MTHPNSSAVTLNNGVRLPALGLGVFQSSPTETVVAVESAIAAGYRLIDTAAAYFNEREVGQAIARSEVARDELFVQTKLWISDYGYDSTLRAYDISLRRLGLSTIDLYLLHQPMPNEWARTVAAYHAAEHLLREGRVRAIGVSNFSVKQLDDLMEVSEIVPAVNQVEVHPFFAQRELRLAHQRRGIATQAWSPLGGVNVYMPNGSTARSNPLTHPAVRTLADRYDKTPAQVVLRWHVQHGLSAIPKSVRPARIIENYGIFDFTLTAADVASLDALDTGVRGGPEPDTIDTKLFTFGIPE